MTTLRCSLLRNGDRLASVRPRIATVPRMMPLARMLSRSQAIGRRAMAAITSPMIGVMTSRCRHSEMRKMSGTR